MKTVLVFARAVQISLEVYLFGNVQILIDLMCFILGTFLPYAPPLDPPVTASIADAANAAVAGQANSRSISERG